MPSYGFRDIRVLGEGPLDTDIYIIGEGPGLQEEKYGRPWIGDVGKELDRILGAAGIERRKCYLDNITQYKPYGDKALAFKPDGRSPSEVYALGIKNITDIIREHRPKVVVAVGGYALWGLTLLDSITKYRGSILEAILIPGQKIVATLHPSYLLRGQWVMRNPVIWDFEKAKLESQCAEINKPEYDWVVAGPKEEMPLAEAEKEILGSERFVVDIETFGGKNLACVGYGLSNNRAIVVPDAGSLTTEFYRTTLENNIFKILQLAMFDYTFMACVKGITIQGIAWDTLLASHTLYPDLPKGLDFLCSIYTRQAYYKNEGKIWRKTGDLNRFWHYNAIDCCNEYKVYEEQQAEVDRAGVRETAEFMTALVEPYGEATVFGMGVDRILMDKMKEEHEVTAAELQGKLEALIGREINVRSHKQVVQLVYKELKLPKRVKNKSLTTDKKVLLDLAAKTKNPELNMIVEIRENMKFANDFADATKILDEGRFRCSFNICGTGFSRLSSSMTVWGAGTNQQNFPDEARKFIVADKGTSLIVVDLMQAEAIVVAFIAEDELEIGWFLQELDSHVMLASLIFNKDPEDIVFAERFIAKTSHHALNYIMGDYTFTLTVNKGYRETGISLEQKEAKAIRLKYLALRPALSMWWDSEVRSVMETGELTTCVKSEFQPKGRTRQFLERYSDKLRKQIVSFRPQGSVGDVCHHGVLRYWRDPEMKELRSESRIVLLSQQHDGVIYQIADEVIDDTVPKLMKMCLVNLEANGRKFIIPVEAKVGKAWNKDSLGDHSILRG